MSNKCNPISDPDQPTVSQIRIKGHLDLTEQVSCKACQFSLQIFAKRFLPVRWKTVTMIGLLKDSDLGMPLISVVPVQFNVPYQNSSKKGEETMTTVEAIITKEMINSKEKKTSIQRFARTAGVLYLLIAVLSIPVHFIIPSQLIVAGDAATTANNIMASEGLFRMGIGIEFVLLLTEVLLSILLYVLFKPVNKTLSLIAAVSRMAMTTIHGVNLLNHFIVLIILSGASYLTVFAPNQLHALVMIFLEAYEYGFSIGVVFLFLHALILGYLIFKSGYFPKILGILFTIASLGYLIDSFSHILIANYKTGPVYIAIPITIAEIAFPLWLLIKGVNMERWNKLTSTST